MDDFAVGERVYWSFSADGRQRGVLVPAVVVKVTPGRITIEHAIKAGSEWVRERRVVSRQKISLRTTPARELDEV
jgi:hypothetical protein